MCIFLASQTLIEDVEELNATLDKWINAERFGFFPKISRSNINEMMDTGKYIAIVVVAENKLNEITQTERDFKDMVEGIIKLVWWWGIHMYIVCFKVKSHRCTLRNMCSNQVRDVIVQTSLISRKREKPFTVCW